MTGPTPVGKGQQIAERSDELKNEPGRAEVDHEHLDDAGLFQTLPKGGGSHCGQSTSGAGSMGRWK